MRDRTDGPWRWPAVLPTLSCACLALGSCSDAERGSGASPSPDTSGTVPASAVQPILVSPERCPVGAEGGSVEPWSDVEVVEVEPGRPLHLRGCESEGEAFVEFSYVRPLPVAGLHLLEVALYEGGVWIVVNGVTGRRWTLSGVPRLSPDRRWLATTILDLEAGYQRNHLEVWAVEADSLRRVLALEGGDEWGGTDLRWRSSDTIEFRRVTRRAQPELRFDSTTTRVIRRDGEWTPEPPPDTRVPPGMTLPYVISPACPGEYCSFSAPRLVCDSARVFERPGSAESQTGWLASGDELDVETGLVLVHVPGAVRVTREVRQSQPGEEEIHLLPGDTIFPLYHRGEGFWEVWHVGRRRTVEMFWPWQHWRTPPDYVFSGEVLQEVTNDFWLSVSTEVGVGGWISAGWPEVIQPVGQVPPYECPVRRDG